MELGQSMEHIAREIFFFKNYAENETERLVPDQYFQYFLKMLNMR